MRSSTACGSDGRRGRDLGQAQGRSAEGAGARQRRRAGRGQGRVRARHPDRAHPDSGRAGRHHRLAHARGRRNRGHDRRTTALGDEEEAVRLAGAASTSRAALERATLVFAEPTPDARILVGLERVLQAHLGHGAPGTHRLGLVDLVDGRAGVADREEQFGVGGETGGFVTPIHGGTPSSLLLTQSRSRGVFDSARGRRVTKNGGIEISGLTYDPVGVTSTDSRVSYLLRLINSYEWDNTVSTARRPALLWLLIVLLAVEFVAVAALAIVLLIETLTAPSAVMGGGIALTVIAFVAAAWLGAIVVGALRGQAWIRAAAIVWQVLQVAIGAGALQGQFAQPGWGWPLIVLAAVVLLLLFTKPVVALIPGRRDPS